MIRLETRIDDYVLGRLDRASAASFEAELQADRALQARVKEAECLMTTLNRLGSDVLAEPVPESFLQLLEGAR
ncbi:hypothetical protein [Caenispirillum bisanense]|uniref:Uncharacterized protein n=1 Tax=Caenispirillum bisanense TaxID=414052 RepID=A0A286GVX2_9PROT|nr:hypothetical protein [Caenispirillum bisanense]SOD99631.1 hypothetical protein SAMN05421508_10999 [Caenispirillum bisanense]